MDSKINEWLQKFEIIKEIAVETNIHSERLTEDVRNLALQRTGVEELPLDYVGEKGWKRQYQYILLLKSESEIDKQRLYNLDWLDKLSDEIYKVNQNCDYPILEDKKVVNVNCANGITYQESEDGTISIYSLQIQFDIKGGM